MQIKKLIIFIAIICVLIFMCYGTGYIKGRESIDIKTDTVVVEKVIVERVPEYISEKEIITQTVKVPIYTLFPETKDSIDSLENVILDLNKNNSVLVQIKDSLEIELQRIQRYYKSDDYEAWVSGIDPRLDSLKIKQRTHQITNTSVIIGEKFWLNVGLNVNGWTNTPYVINPNVNLSYTWKRTTFTGEFGLSVPVHNTAGTIPYIQLGIDYSLWSF